VGAVDPVIYLVDRDGVVSAVDGAKGGSAPAAWSPVSLGGLQAQAAAAGVFTAYGGTFDYLLVGTRESGVDNRFYALDPSTGSPVGSYFDNGGVGTGIGIISAMASVDYASSRVFFTSYRRSGGSQNTLWCLQLQTPSPSPFTLAWSRQLGDIDSSPVLRGGRVYVGSPLGTGTLYSLDAANGSAVDDRTFVHMDGQVKGFVFPDRGSGDLFFATNQYVWAVTDTGSPTMVNKFAGGITLDTGVVPTSAVLYLSDSQKVYVGGSDGRLYQIDVSSVSPIIDSVPLGDGSAAVGAPSFDREHGLIHVGTEAGVFYAVEVPFLP
jgi:hypothetical protein